MRGEKPREMRTISAQPFHSPDSGTFTKKVCRECGQMRIMPKRACLCGACLARRSYSRRGKEKR